MPKISTKDWRNLPIEQWNTTTFTAYLEHLTKENAGVTYEPTGSGSKTQRWAREKGMMKQAQTKYGAAVVKRFIELCFAKHTPKPNYPYPSFAFMYSFMSELFPVAEREVAKAETFEQAAQESDVKNVDESWF